VLFTYSPDHSGVNGKLGVSATALALTMTARALSHMPMRRADEATVHLVEDLDQSFQHFRCSGNQMGIGELFLLWVAVILCQFRCQILAERRSLVSIVIRPDDIILRVIVPWTGCVVHDLFTSSSFCGSTCSNGELQHRYFRRWEQLP